MIIQLPIKLTTDWATQFKFQVAKMSKVKEYKYALYIKSQIPDLDI